MVLRLLVVALPFIAALITPAQRLARPRRRQTTNIIRMDSTELDVGGARLSIYDGRVALQWDVRYRRETAPAAGASAVDVRESPGKGRGAFAATKIAAGAFLGTYAGDALTGDDYEARYGGAAAVPEYVVRVDGDLYLDGRAAVEVEVAVDAHDVLGHGRRAAVARLVVVARQRVARVGPEERARGDLRRGERAAPFARRLADVDGRRAGRGRRLAPVAHVPLQRDAPVVDRQPRAADVELRRVHADDVCGLPPPRTREPLRWRDQCRYERQRDDEQPEHHCEARARVGASSLAALRAPQQVLNFA